MKRFAYFEHLEGGMAVSYFSNPTGLPMLYGWMQEDVVADDQGLLDFIVSAEVGDEYDHRLGVCVRLKDKP